MSAGSNGAWAGAGQAIARIGEMGMQSNLEDFRQQRLTALRQEEKTDDRAYAAEGKQDDRDYAKGLLDENREIASASAGAQRAYETEQSGLDRASREKVAGIKAGVKGDPDRSLSKKDKFVFEQYKDQYLELNKDYNDRVEMNEEFAGTPRGVEMKKDMLDLRGRLDTYFSDDVKDPGMKSGAVDAVEKPVSAEPGLLDQKPPEKQAPVYKDSIEEYQAKQGEKKAKDAQSESKKQEGSKIHAERERLSRLDNKTMNSMTQDDARAAILKIDELNKADPGAGKMGLLMMKKQYLLDRYFK